MQWYGNVPVTVNIRENVPRDCVSDFGPSSNVTLCRSAPGAHVQVTVAPNVMLLAGGSKALLRTLMLVVLPLEFANGSPPIVPVGIPEGSQATAVNVSGATMDRRRYRRRLRGAFIAVSQC